MHSQKFWGIFSIALAGCGGSSGSDLFGSSAQPPCAAGSAACGAPDSSATGGATTANTSGGAGGAGGDLAGGGAGGEGTTTGGFGGLSFGSGGAAIVDAGRPDTGAGAVCPVRAFSGVVAGSNYSSAIGKIDVKATIVFTVDSSGTIQGTYTGTTPIVSKATLTGSMSCRTGAVTIAIQGGSYNGTFPFTTGGTFSGTMTGTYSSGTASFSGEWKVVENNPAYGGEGSWNAN